MFPLSILKWNRIFERLVEFQTTLQEANEKKKKETKEEENISEDAQSKQNNGNLVVGDDAQALGKKGTVKKYSNGLEIVNVSMGTPDGRQATRGKKVRTCYMFIDNMIIWKLCMRL